MVIRGARQVGKTWLVRELASISKKQLIEINFEYAPKLAGAFSHNDPMLVLRDLGLALDIEISPQNCILFLDEIQVVPELLAKLRWFYELLPELPVIAAGSLLDFTLAQHTFSMPVGRITYLHVEPLSFEEFLLACGHQKLIAFISTYHLQEKITPLIHEKLTQLFNEYVIIGGMPAVVANWVKTKSFSSVLKQQTDLLQVYRDDFYKYSNKLSNMVLDKVMSAIPQNLGRKFVYSHISKEIKIAEIKEAIALLCKARICFKIQATAANGLPLSAELNEKYFKLAFLDVGLVSAALGLRLDQINSLDDLNMVNRGALAEQIVAQLLRASTPEFLEPASFCWIREEKSASAEIDYIIQHKNNVIPIEVKSGKTGSMKSLHIFMQQKNYQKAVRIYAGFPGVTDVSVTTQHKEKASYELLSLPFYLVSQLTRLLDTF